jgi:hypothetical protein
MHKFGYRNELDRILDAMNQLSKANQYSDSVVQQQAVNGSVLLRRSGLIISRPLRFHIWEQVGQQLLVTAESSVWWIADWLLYGETTFHDRYREAITRTSLDYQTLRNYVWVARRFDLSRRRDNLSFGHHAEVAALNRPEQDFWLRKADELGWSRNELRRQVRQSLRERGDRDSSRLRRGREYPDESGRRDQMPCPDAASHGHRPQDRPHRDGPRPVAIPAQSSASQLLLHLNSNQLTQVRAAASVRQLGVEDWAISVLLEAAATLDPVGDTEEDEGPDQSRLSGTAESSS